MNRQYTSRRFRGQTFWYRLHTVDGRNPAPVDRWFIYVYLIIYRVSTIQDGADFGTIHGMSSSAKAWVSSSLKSWPTASGALALPCRKSIPISGTLSGEFVERVTNMILGTIKISQHIWTHQPCFPLRMSSTPFCQHGPPRKKTVPKRGASEVWAFAKLHFRDEALLKAAGWLRWLAASPKMGDAPISIPVALLKGENGDQPWFGFAHVCSEFSELNCCSFFVSIFLY